MGAGTLLAIHARSRFWSRLANSRSRSFFRFCHVPDEDWSAAMAFERGSFATFLAFTVLPERIHGYAVGDSVLFIFDEEGCVQWLPPLLPDEFGKDPTLLATCRGLSFFAESEEDFTSARIDVLRGPDKFARIKAIAATDALAAWAVGNGDKKEVLRRLTSLIDLRSNFQFQDFVQRERAARSMKKDNYGSW